MSPSYAKGFNVDEHYWPRIIQQKIPNLNFCVNGAPSRDIQTIIDVWIKTIPFLTKYDWLIIIVPFFNRTRLPLDKDYWYGTDIINDTDIKITNKFVGTRSYSNSNTKLEFWGDKYDFEHFVKILEPQEIINSSIASQLNYIEIIESLDKITPAKTYIFSWDEMQCKSKLIEDKSDITKQIGVWETLNDDWNNSNGIIGKEGDFHWGLNMNKLMADFIIIKLNLIPFYEKKIKNTRLL